MAKKRIKSKPGLFGMVYYYDEDGNPIGKSRPGLIEGTRVYTDNDGRYAGKSRPSIFAKEVFTDTDNNHITSYDTLGGEAHFQNGTPIGHSTPGFFDSEYTTIDEEDEIWPEEYYDEMDCSDDYLPEELPDNLWIEDVEEEPYEEYTSGISRYTVVKWLQLFVFFLIFCMIIVSICAIILLN